MGGHIYRQSINIESRRTIPNRINGHIQQAQTGISVQNRTLKNRISGLLFGNLPDNRYLWSKI